MAIENLNFNNLSEKELREINKATQVKLDAIEAEKKRKAELKKNYALRDVPSTFKVSDYRLSFHIRKHFTEGGQETLSKEAFEKYLKQSTDEIKPEKSDIYKCPECGEFNLYVGNFGDDWNPKYAVTCDNCDFTMKKKESAQWDVWETFHNWLVKHGYLDESVKFQY